MSGDWIEITASDGSGSFRGYVATPESGSGPGILLLQEIFGVRRQNLVDLGLPELREA